ncbi:MAG: aminotransferase class V-fold PLP-dependent enzyme, partial [Clostridia bacterium]|nr:aminotransferase class V-fold PLP-dependent enzyme [Clostridia bacterium]
MTKIIYFDNAATTNFKPYCVKKTFFKALKQSSNPGRSGHKLSIKNAINVWQCRETIAKHFNIDNPESVIFTKNCTEALNLAILGVLKDGDHVICSVFEHNSVLRPLKHLEMQNKITLTIISPKNNKNITLLDLKPHILSNTSLICLTHTSNVTGIKQNIEEIGQYLKQKNILFLVDFAQGAGHFLVDMKKNNINYLAFAGHKGFFTPQGIGGLVINSTTLPKPLMFGGTGTESELPYQPNSIPESLESGTLATPLICALNSGIKYVEKHFKKHSNYVYNLTKYLIDNLKTI